MNDIATLGIAIDTTQVGKGVTELDKLTAAAGRAEASASKVGAEVSRQSAAMSQSTSATSQAAGAIDRASKAYQQLDAEVERVLISSSKMATAQAALGKSQAILSDGLAAGIISQKTYDSGLAALTAKYGPAAEGATKLATAHGAGTISAGFLTRELRALGDELASGRTRQAEGTFALLATRLTNLGPAGLAAAAGVAAIGVAIYEVVSHGEELQRAILAVQNGFAATGTASVISRQQITDYIDSMSLLPGVSRDAATKVVTEFARVPGITGPQFDQATKQVRDFSSALGVDVAEGARRYASALVDPLRVSDQLDKQFNLLTTDQRLLIATYVEHGEKQRALDVLTGSLQARFAGLADNGLTPLEKAANRVSSAWTLMLRSLGSGDTLLRSLNQSEIGGFELSAPATAGPAASVATPSGGRGASATTGSTSATGQAQAGQSDRERQLNQETDSYRSRASLNQKLMDQEKGLRDLIAQENDTIRSGTASENERVAATAARARNLDKIAYIEERLAAPKAKAEPLGLNVDRSALEASLKAFEVQSTAEKNMLAEDQKLRDFYHKAGILNDEDYNRATEQANNDSLAKQQAFFDKRIAAVVADEAKLKALRPKGTAQANEVNTAINADEKQRITLLGQEDELTRKIAADNAFREKTAPILKAQEDFNRALKETAETQSALTAVETRTSLEVQLGIKTQFEGLKTIDDARASSIAKLQQELALEIQLHDLSALDHRSTEYIAQAKAIDDTNTKLLKMQAELDPIGQKINGFVDSGFAAYLDKLGSGGVRSFKDLRAASTSFFEDITKQLLHLANQNIADSLAKSLGLSTGSAGGIGGYLSSHLFGSGSMSSLFGGTSASASALASTTSTAGSSINAGITDEALALFHDGGVVGQSSAMRQVRFTQGDVDNAPRFHAGGLAGYEQLSVLKKGEEVLTENDPRHRNNGGGRDGRTINVTNNFPIANASTLRPQSQHQIAQQAASAINKGMARS